ncbi:peptidase S33 family protein [Abortiporus biennis]
MAAVETPFTINIPDSEIEFLHKKLELSRFPDELEDARWDYGVPLSDIKRLVALWKDGFDWRKSEESINNELPQFTKDIEIDDFGTLNIHYVHQKSEVKDAVPLLFVHGWPGHFLEARKILPLLVEAKPDEPSFHVVALSLPGYGFSEAPKKKGFGLKQYAQVSHKLMLSLGYNEYVTQGGDWGYAITQWQAALYGPKHVKAWHTNFPETWAPTLTKNPLLYLSNLLPWSAKDKAGAERSNWFLTKGIGYNMEHSTQPQTIGYSLADSPVGLLAWIYEKLVQWTDDYPWTDEEVLEWVSIYWFSRAGPAASIRIYYEVTLVKDFVQFRPWSRTPFGYSSFPKDLIVRPKSWCRTIGNVVFEKIHNDGGHFASHERPEVLVADLREMFGKGGPAFGVVPGKNGY